MFNQKYVIGTACTPLKTAFPTLVLMFVCVGVEGFHHPVTAHTPTGRLHRSP